MKINAKFSDGFFIVENKREVDYLREKDFGFIENKRCFLDIFEGLYLMEKKKLSCEKTIEEIEKEGLKRHEHFFEKYSTYKELKNMGFKVKSGLKFGFDFRVYIKGKKHTEYVVFVIPQRKTLSPEELTRSQRLASSINANCLLALVDLELNVVFYILKRFKGVENENKKEKN